MGSREDLFPGAEKVELFLSDLAGHREDLAAGFGSVYLPGALDRKYPNAAREWRWQYVFPARDRSTDPRSGTVQRHHLDEATKQKAIRAAVARTGITKRAPTSNIQHPTSNAEPGTREPGYGHPEATLNQGIQKVE
jgi:hypothetical protein